MPKKGKKGKKGGKKKAEVPVRKNPPPRPRGSTTGSIARLEHHSQAVSALEISSEGGTFFSASLDGTVAIVDIARAAVVHQFGTMMHGEHSEMLCLSKIGPSLMVGTDSGRLYQMDVRTSCFVRRLKSLQGRVLSVSEGTRPHEMITGGQDGTVLIWDLRVGKKLSQHAVHSSAVCCVNAMEGRVFSSSWDQSIMVMDVEAKTRTRLCTGTALKFLPEDRPFKPFTNIQLSSVTRTTASPRKDVPSTCPGLFAWTLGEGEVTDDGSHTSTYVHDICKASGGTVYKIVPNRPVTAHGAESQGTAPGSKGGSQVYCAYADGCVRRWEVENQRVDKTLIAHSSSATAVYLDEAAGNLFSGSEDGTVCVWDLDQYAEDNRQMNPIFEFKGHADGVSDLKAFGRKLLISSSWDMTVRLWDASNVDDSPSKALEAEMERQRAAEDDERIS